MKTILLFFQKYIEDLIGIVRDVDEHYKITSKYFYSFKIMHIACTIVIAIDLVFLVSFLVTSSGTSYS